jgi:hypothetical protein
MKNVIFWNITPFSPLTFNICFGEIISLLFQGTYKTEEDISVKSTCHLLSRSRWDRYNPLKRRFTFNGLQGVVTRVRILLTPESFIASVKL